MRNVTADWRIARFAAVIGLGCALGAGAAAIAQANVPRESESTATIPAPVQGQVQGQGGVHNEHVPAQRIPMLPANGEGGQPLAGAAKTEDVLAELVHRAGVIFAGEVYAIRMPEGEANQGTVGGQHSSNANVVEIEFRVDQGIRGTSVGDAYVLKEWVGLWRNRPAPFKLHQRAVVFLYPPNAAGLSSPVGGMVGVLPIEAGNQVDLRRLHTYVHSAAAVKTQSTGTDASTHTPSTHTSGAGKHKPQVPGVATEAGEETLVSGTDSGGMPELDSSNIPFLALLRDVYVLSAAEGNGAAKPATK